jgi:23S rRNA pseudouridine1911/1915/1917 synthase
MKYHFCAYTEKKIRVDMYISALFWELSRSYIQKLIDTGCVRVNGTQVKKNLKISHRDEISLEEILLPSDLEAENIPLDIIYEDENICVVNKDAGMNVHPTPWIEGKKGTLVNALLYHCRDSLPNISGEERPGIVHRLDKDTSGVILTAKTDSAMKYIAEKIKKREVKKYYIAVVVGIFPEKEFVIESDIWRHPTDRTRMTTQYPLSPKYALTNGELVGYGENKYSVLKIDLKTGRTHQIRVHLADIGYPIIGDSVYGDEKTNSEAKKKYGISRQMLHAREFHIELYGEEKIFIAPLKIDMKKLLELLGVQL